MSPPTPNTRRTRNDAPRATAGATANAPADELLVRSPAAAALFLDRARLRYLRPFMIRPCSISAAARTLDVSLSRMSYQVRKLHGLGLLIELPPRSRRDVRRFAAAARRFVVPLEAVPIDDLQALYRRFTAPRQHEQLVSVVNEALRLAHAWEIRFPEPAGTDRVAIEPAVGTATTVGLGVIDQGWTLQLTPTAARRMQRELLEVVARHAALPPQPRAESFLVALTMVRRNLGSTARRVKKRV